MIAAGIAGFFHVVLVGLIVAGLCSVLEAIAMDRWRKKMRAKALRHRHAPVRPLPPLDFNQPLD